MLRSCWSPSPARPGVGERAAGWTAGDPSPCGPASAPCPGLLAVLRTVRLRSRRFPRPPRRAGRGAERGASCQAVRPFPCALRKGVSVQSPRPGPFASSLRLLGESVGNVYQLCYMSCTGYPFRVRKRPILSVHAGRIAAVTVRHPFPSGHKLFIGAGPRHSPSVPTKREVESRFGGIRFAVFL